MLAKNVREFIEAEGLISRQDSVLAAVSGGADSVALLYVLFDLRKDMGFTLKAAHLNHGIRGKVADEDAAFVEKVCQDLGINCHIEQVDTPSFATTAKLSMEEAARELRHKFLKEKAQAGHHNKIALGHTMNDQAETVLMHLIRGAGILGVSGMRPMSEVRVKPIWEADKKPVSQLGEALIGEPDARPFSHSAMRLDIGREIEPDSRLFFIRPFLATTRAEIQEFLASRGIPYREDASNVDTAFMRNRVRHELMEILKEKYNPRIVEALSSHAALATEVEDYLSKVVSEAYQLCVREETSENIELELTPFLSYHVSVQGYVLREAFRRLCGSLKDLGFTHTASLVNLASSGQSGDSVDVASGISAWLDGRSLWIGHTPALRREGVNTPNFFVQLEPGQEIWLPDISLRIDSEVLNRDAQDDKLGRDKPGKDDLLKSGPDSVFFDLEKLERPLALRNLEPGDRIAPFGIDGTKKIQDLLVDLKVPRSRRKKLAAFCDRNQILWLVGIRRSSVAPVTRATRWILSMKATTSPDELGRDRT
jgi:tRNA(Ile)-lysidine synthase